MDYNVRDLGSNLLYAGKDYWDYADDNALHITNYSIDLYNFKD